jgi:eukaryotic-like serine/threonine-protein kinase
VIDMSDVTDTTVLLKHRCLKCSVEMSSQSENETCTTCDEPCVRVSQDPFIGKTMGGKYRVIDLIATGGMGKVYSAVHELLNTKVAVKVLPDTGMTVKTSSSKPSMLARKG